MTELPTRVLELAEQAAADHGVEVLDARFAGGGRGRTLSVTLDADEPVESDVVERVSKQLSRALDAEDPIAGAYTLEVTTPGLDRPLHSARDFRRQLGHEVLVDIDEGELHGVVAAIDEHALTLQVAGDQVRVPLASVRKGKVVLPW
jgi:ribosome maturation factor RimP